MKDFDLNAIRVFVRVVQAGSYSEAGRQMDMPKSTVSMKVSELEARLGVSLLVRTTRKVSLTESGARYYKVCERILSELQEAESGTAQTQQEPQGFLRITAPVEMGAGVLPEVIASFLKKHVKLSIELILTDRVIDLVGENVDVAIRAGPLEDSSLIARRLGVSEFRIYGSPQYLKKRGTPERIADLTSHECLGFTGGDARSWGLVRGEKTVRVPIGGRFMANNMVVLKEMAIAGQGLALLPSFLCAEEAERGKLVAVLSGWVAEQDQVHLVYPAQRYLPPKLRAFVDFVSKELKVAF